MTQLTVNKKTADRVCWAAAEDMDVCVSARETAAERERERQSDRQTEGAPARHHYAITWPFARRPAVEAGAGAGPKAVQFEIFI